jgi:hypothetical protein
MGSMRNAASFPMRCTDRSLSRATSAFLTVEFARAPIDFAATERIMGAKARIGALALHRLMHNRHIRLNSENVIR